MVAITHDTPLTNAASFLFSGLQMSENQSPKELEYVPLAEIESWSRQLMMAADYLQKSAEKMRTQGVQFVTTHAKTVRKSVPSLRKWSSTVPGLVDDQQIATETGKPTVKEQMALKHAKAKSAKASKK